MAETRGSKLMQFVPHDNIVQNAELRLQTVLQYAPDGQQADEFWQFAQKIHYNSGKIVIPTPVTMNELEEMLMELGIIRSEEEREALTVTSAMARPRLGTVFAGQPYEAAMPFIHGSQGCVAFDCSHLSRDFKGPSSYVSSPMTEDTAVFGGSVNRVDGLAKAEALHDFKMIAVSTTCWLRWSETIRTPSSS